MAPHTIMFGRHAEKPADSGLPHGVDHHGQIDGHRLSVHGWIRAGALAVLFDQLTSTRAGLVRPQRVMATRPSKDYASKREHDTARPTAERLGLAVDDQFAHDQVAQAAASLLADPRDTLVVWHHGSIPELMSHLPLSNPSGIPKAWPEDRFDLIWCLTVNEAGQYAFTEVAQDLLAGDRSQEPLH